MNEEEIVEKWCSLGFCESISEDKKLSMCLVFEELKIYMNNNMNEDVNQQRSTTHPFYLSQTEDSRLNEQFFICLIPVVYRIYLGGGSIKSGIESFVEEFKKFIIVKKDQIINVPHAELELCALFSENYIEKHKDDFFDKRVLKHFLKK